MMKGVFKMYYTNYPRDGRVVGGGFVLPFITGALVGGAAVGVSRPRPIIANQGPYPYGPNYGYGPGYAYGPRPFFY